MKKLKIELTSRIAIYLSTISFAISWITFYFFMYLEEIRLTKIMKSMPLPMFDYWYHYQPYNYLFGVNISFGCLGCVLLMIYIEKNLPTFKDVYRLIIRTLKTDKKTKHIFIYIFVCLFVYILMRLFMYLKIYI